MGAAERIDERAFVALAIALPLALACVHHGLGHDGDIEFFRDWYLAVRRSLAFYRDGPGLNYPIVGVLLVTGPACAVDAVLGHALDLASYRAVLKVTLVLGEILFVLAAERLARALGEPRSRTLALGLYALPSSWAGGAWFGQIDVWGTVLLLVAAASAVRYRADGRTRSLCEALLALVAAILTKQLTWFAVPALVALIALGLARHRSRLHVGFAALAPLLFFAADPLLTLPSGYASHLWLVATHGSSHGDLVVASGASLWSLLVPGGTPSSSIVWLGLDARAWGWIAFALSQLVVARKVWRAPSDRLARTVRSRPCPGQALPYAARVREHSCPDRALVLAAGLGELAMATLLTGVHERYLAHAIPLAILARGTQPPRTSLAVGVALGVLSGLFVLATLSPDALALFARPEPVAILAFAWGAVLVVE